MYSVNTVETNAVIPITLIRTISPIAILITPFASLRYALSIAKRQ